MWPFSLTPYGPPPSRRNQRDFPKGQTKPVPGTPARYSPFLGAATLVRLVRQALSALCSAARQHLTAVSVRHSLSETVLLFSVELLGLISSQHVKPSFRGVKPCNLAL